MAMKAWVLHDVNNIRYEEVDIPMLDPKEVCINVKAAGICGSDIPRIYKTGAHKMPIILGHEFSGMVEGIGKDVSPYWLGRRVGVYPLVPCGDCKSCRSGQPEMCRDYDYIGSRRDGAFAEYVAVPVDNLIEIPSVVSFEQAAMLEPMAVAVHAMRKGVGEDNAAVSLETRIVVCGLGTIGLLLIMFLMDRGYRNIYIIGNKESQKDRAVSLGVSPDNYCDSDSGDTVKWLQETVGGADVYFECVGKNECISYGVDGAAPGGRIVLVGNPYSDMQFRKDIYWKILRNQLTIMGTWNSTFLQRGGEDDLISDDWGYVMKRLEAGKIRPENLITHRLKPDKLEEGFHIMRDKTEDYCKIIRITE